MLGAGGDSNSGRRFKNTNGQTGQPSSFSRSFCWKNPATFDAQISRCTTEKMASSAVLRTRVLINNCAQDCGLGSFLVDGWSTHLRFCLPLLKHSPSSFPSSFSKGVLASHVQASVPLFPPRDLPLHPLPPLPDLPPRPLPAMTICTLLCCVPSFLCSVSALAFLLLCDPIYQFWSI